MTIRPINPINHRPAVFDIIDELMSVTRLLPSSSVDARRARAMAEIANVV